MTDIVERLRRRHGLTHDPDQLWDVISTLTNERHEAADEIERLRAQVEELDRMWRAAEKGPTYEIEKLRAQVVSLQSSLEVGKRAGKK